jgi:putative acetyltransferase
LYFRNDIWGTVSVRHAEPEDVRAMHRMHCGPRVTAGTMQLPQQSVEDVCKRFFSLARGGSYDLVGCVDEEVVGLLGSKAFVRPRRRHVSEIGMALRDD